MSLTMRETSGKPQKRYAATHKVNIGSGDYPLPGWTNVDMHCPADIRADFRTLTFEGLEAVRMSHVLEHISWRETDAVLKQIRSWMRPGGTLTVEVPDIEKIMELGTQHPLWFKYVFGDQSHEGEYHKAGFTAGSLGSALTDACWYLASVRRFISTHPGRDGMPCLEAVALRVKLCECGCGRPTARYNKTRAAQGHVKGEYARYLHGHNKRTGPFTLDSNGYEQTRLVPDRFAVMCDSGGYVMRHRLIVAEILGRPLRPNEHVHHINGNHRDNRAENLQVVSPSEHARIHKGRREVVPA